MSRGVAPGPNPGAETVAFIPVAEKDGDILSSERIASGQGFVDFQLRDGLNSAQAILNALASESTLDIALAPEFTVSEERADELADALVHRISSTPRLLIAGSGASRTRSGSQAWNEARALNGCGAELWRQRKIWPAGLSQDRTRDIGLSDPGVDGQLLEDTAAGDCIEVVDADGLGRCVVLICQDLQARPLADEIVQKFQPDWVFVPILDIGVQIGRWMHQRSFDLSALSQSRFLIVSSTAWADKARIEPHCGMAIGPKEPTGLGGAPIDLPRAVTLATSPIGSSPGVAKVQWRRGRWLQTQLGAVESEPGLPVAERDRRSSQGQGA